MKNIIFLRGLSRESGHWGPFKDLLLSHSWDLSTIEFLDTAGNGSEYTKTSFLKISSYTEDLRSRSLLISKKTKPFIVGVSMGGMIACDWALRYPDEISGFVLINTSFGTLSDPWERLNPEVLSRLIKLISSKNLDLEILRFISNQNLEYKKYWAQKFSELPSPKVLNFLRQLTACARFLGSRKSPPKPALILASHQDRMVSYTCSEAIHSFWKSEYYLHPWAGHDLPFDDPQWVLDHLKIFFSTHSS
jgi:pimeloyl-[acyl-carrier protein] methyl ester esterase